MPKVALESLSAMASAAATGALLELNSVRNASADGLPAAQLGGGPAEDREFPRRAELAVVVAFAVEARHGALLAAGAGVCVHQERLRTYTRADA